MHQEDPGMLSQMHIQLDFVKKIVFFIDTEVLHQRIERLLYEPFIFVLFGKVHYFVISVPATFKNMFFSMIQ